MRPAQEGGQKKGTEGPRRLPSVASGHGKGNEWLVYGGRKERRLPAATRLTCDPICCAQSTCPRCVGDRGGPRPEPQRGTPTWGTETRNASTQPLPAALHPAQLATRRPEPLGGPAPAESKGPQARPKAPRVPRAWAVPAASSMPLLPTQPQPVHGPALLRARAGSEQSQMRREGAAGQRKLEPLVAQLGGSCMRARPEGGTDAAGLQCPGIALDRPRGVGRRPQEQGRLPRRPPTGQLP